jgi:hypothetical protein
VTAPARQVTEAMVTRARVTYHAAAERERPGRRAPGRTCQQPASTCAPFIILGWYCIRCGEVVR